MNVVMLKVGLLYPKVGARPVIQSRVDVLAASIAEIGLLNPVVVRPTMGSQDGRPSQVYEILAGRHRVTALGMRLNQTVIPCIVRQDDDLRAELVMIDENLCRAELSPAQLAYQTDRRKEIYEALHPETRSVRERGGPGRGKNERQVGGSLVATFSADTAIRTGRSERAVQRDAARGKALGEDLNRVAGTSLDTGANLDALAKMPREQREPIIAKAVAGQTVSARVPSHVGQDNRALHEMSITPLLREFGALWVRATPEEREAIKAAVTEFNLELFG